MCTVIYFPASEGALFSSCRDEDPARTAALLPTLYKSGNSSAVYAKDGAAGGTLAGMNVEGNVIILLNGAFEKHEKEQQYRKSRGLIVKQLLFVADPVKEWSNYDVHNIEPFTLVIWHRNVLCEAVWDGRQKHIFPHDINKPNIWSSSTLYDNAAKDIRRQWFDAGLENKAFQDACSLQAFLLAHKEALNGFVMKRNQRLQTLSISCFQVQDNQVSMYYNDLVNNAKEEITLLTKANITQ